MGKGWGVHLRWWPVAHRWVLVLLVELLHLLVRLPPLLLPELLGVKVRRGRGGCVVVVVVRVWLVVVQGLGVKGARGALTHDASTHSWCDRVRQ